MLRYEIDAILVGKIESEVKSEIEYRYLYILHGALVNMIFLLTLLESELYADSGRSS